MDITTLRRGFKAVCGIVANQSALKDGERMKVPQYRT